MLSTLACVPPTQAASHTTGTAALSLSPHQQGTHPHSSARSAHPHSLIQNASGRGQKALDSHPSGEAASSPSSKAYRQLLLTALPTTSPDQPHLTVTTPTKLVTVMVHMLSKELRVMFQAISLNTSLYSFTALYEEVPQPCTGVASSSWK